MCLEQGDEDAGCVALIVHTEVEGAAGYVVDFDGGRTECETLFDSSSVVLCRAEFTADLPDDSEAVLRAVDEEGNPGTPSEPFRILRST